MLNYKSNDPDNPIVISNLDATLPNPCPNFSVVGRNGNPVTPSQIQAEFVHTTVASFLRFYQDRLQNKITTWKRTNNLIVIPRAFQQLNAFYSGDAVKFGWFSPSKGRILYLAESTETVTHELGHGICDLLKPQLWGAIGTEYASFHEACGDILAMLFSLSFAEVIDHILKETNNNIRISNAVSKIGESIGRLLIGKDFLRNAVNNFNYVVPESIGKSAPFDQLSSECHSFSRIFSGTYYQFICNQYEKHLAINPSNPHEALALARDECCKVFINAIPIATMTPRFFDSVAKAMLIVDSNNGGICKDSIIQAFTERNILQPASMAMSNFAIKMDGEDIKTFTHSEGMTMRVGGIKKIKIAEYMGFGLAQSDNPLYLVDVDIPCEHYFELNPLGEVVTQQPTMLDEALISAKIYLDYLYENDKVSMTEDPDKEFNVLHVESGDHLVRNSICNLN